MTQKKSHLTDSDSFLLITDKSCECAVRPLTNPTIIIALLDEEMLVIS